MEAQWRNELEALQRLLAKQQQQIEILQKQLGAPADDDAEEADVPAAEYRRAFLVVTLIQFTASAYWLIIAFTSLGGVCRPLRLPHVAYFFYLGLPDTSLRARGNHRRRPRVRFSTCW